MALSLLNAGPGPAGAPAVPWVARDPGDPLEVAQGRGLALAASQRCFQITGETAFSEHRAIIQAYTQPSPARRVIDLDECGPVSAKMSPGEVGREGPSTTVASKVSGRQGLRNCPTTFIVIVGGQLLMPPAPAEPGDHGLGGLLHGEDQAPQPLPNLRHAQREARPRRALKAARGWAFWTGGRHFFNTSTAIAPARSTVSRASVHMARVICRYQPVQLRTS
jgi:hypothetical protein